MPLSLLLLLLLFLLPSILSNAPYTTETLTTNIPRTFNSKTPISIKIPQEAHVLYISACIGVIRSYLAENQIPSGRNHQEMRDERGMHVYQLQRDGKQRTYYALVEPADSQTPVTFQILAASLDVTQQQDMRPVDLTEAQRESIEAVLMKEGEVVIRWRPAQDVGRRRSDVLHGAAIDNSTAPNSLQYAIYAVNPQKAAPSCNYATVCGVEAQNCGPKTLLEWSVPGTRTSNGFFEQSIHTVPLGEEKQWTYVVLVRTPNRQRYNIYDPYEFPTNNWTMQLLTVATVLFVAIMVMCCVCGITAVLLVLRRRSLYGKRQGYVPPTEITY